MAEKQDFVCDLCNLRFGCKPNYYRHKNILVG